MNADGNTQDDQLWRQLKTIPAFRALLRAVEARFYEYVDLPAPVLDLGCGDGHFAQMALPGGVAAGIDPWWGPLQKARLTGSYGVVLQALGDRLPFADNAFAGAFSNSVLEHIPDVQPVLNETWRVLRPGGRFLFTTPSHFFTRQLAGAEFWERLGAGDLADRYRAFFNFISRHAHTDPPEVWAARLAEAGFEIERWQYYFSRRALHALEWGHVQGLPSAVLHALLGRWIIAPWESSLRPTERWLRPFYEEEPPAEGAYLLFVARKGPTQPVAYRLPAAEPIQFHRSELPASAFAVADGAIGRTQNVPGPEAVAAATIAAEGSITSTPAESRPETQSPDVSVQPQGDASSRATGWLPALAALLAAAIGQWRLQSNPEAPLTGLAWFAAGGLMLVAFFRRHRSGRILPKLELGFQDVPRARWLYFPALLLSLLAYNRATTLTTGPAWPIFLWVAGALLAFYALGAPRPSDMRNRLWLVGRSDDFLIGLTVALAALIVRVVSLPTIPFILNGSEANIGLDVSAISRGGPTNPFGVGWLTNPTLPLYILAVPVRLLGASVLSIRLLSPLIGALTVLATFWLGRRFFGRAVGLTAAILLAGSHFHLHYSRLGLTNIWDPLLVLLSLGLLGLAWRDQSARRLPWLLAGAAVGGSAYFFTASRLLPLMLAGLFLVALVFARERLRPRLGQLVAAGALALVIALPQLLTYRANPGLFMERANDLGILDSQSGWLSREAAATGRTRGDLWQEQIRRAALAFNATIDTSTLYGPPTPLLSWGTALLWLLGLILALSRLRRLRYAMLVVWVAVTVVFAGILLENPPASHRLIVAAPALSLLAAIALVEIARLLPLGRIEAAGPARNWRVWLPVGAAVLLAVSEIAFYFGPYQTQHRFGDRNTEVAHRMSEYLDALDGDWTAYFYGAPAMYADFPTIPFLAPGFIRNVNLFDVTEAGEAPPPAPSANQTHIFLPERETELRSFQAENPDSRTRAFEGYYATPLFYVVEIQTR